MPEHYDSSSGVTELDTRVIILDAFRQGWIPAVDGELSTRFVPDGPVPGMKRKTPDRFARGEKARRSGKGRLQQPESFHCSQTGPRALSLQQTGLGKPTSLAEEADPPHPRPGLSSSGSGLIEGPSLALPPSQKASEWLVVYHIKSLHVHVVRNGFSTAHCGWWTCGTPDKPMPGARFAVTSDDPASDLGCEWCSRCKIKWDEARSENRPTSSVVIHKVPFHCGILPYEAPFTVCDGFTLVPPVTAFVPVQSALFTVASSHMKSLSL